jgi:hypothetical protein
LSIIAYLPQNDVFFFSLQNVAVVAGSPPKRNTKSNPAHPASPFDSFFWGLDRIERVGLLCSYFPEMWRPPSSQQPIATLPSSPRPNISSDSNSGMYLVIFILRSLSSFLATRIGFFFCFFFLTFCLSNSALPTPSEAYGHYIRGIVSTLESSLLRIIEYTLLQHPFDAVKTTSLAELFTMLRATGFAYTTLPALARHYRDLADGVATPQERLLYLRSVPQPKQKKNKKKIPVLSQELIMDVLLFCF